MFTKMYLKVPAILTALLVFGPIGTASGQQGPSVRAETVVERFHGTLLQAMTEGPELGYEGRRALLDPVVREGFDLSLMTVLMVGPAAWEGIPGATQKAIVDAFSAWTIATYAAQFAAHEGEQFVLLGAEPAPRDTLLVKTQMLLVGEDPIAFDYRLSSRTGSWRIIDIYLEGAISQLALRRSEFSSILKRSGPEGLAARLEEKRARLEKQG